MSNGSVSILGLGELQADFERLSRAAGNKVVRDAVMAGARVARDKARSLAPVDTGRLKKNITATRLKQSETPTCATAGLRVKKPKGKTTKSIKGRGKKSRSTKAVYDAPYYWWFVEYGTSKNPAAPFMRPAWDNSLPQIEKAVTDKLAQGIDNAITG